MKTLPSGCEIKILRGIDAHAYAQDIARLRISMFAEFPYLYEGTMESEQEYLQLYFQSSHSQIILILDQGEVVSFSSALPLTEEDAAIRKPFLHGDKPLDNYLYIGEVMIKSPYRGQGILRHFFETHENFARKNGFTDVVLMTVVRSKDHPGRPKNYRTLDPIWEHFGYNLLPNSHVEFTWQQIDTHAKHDNILALWGKRLV